MIMNKIMEFTFKQDVEDIVDEAEEAGIKAVKELNGKYGRKSHYSRLCGRETLVIYNHKFRSLLRERLTEFNKCSNSIDRYIRYEMTLTGRYNDILVNKGAYYRNIRLAYLDAFLEVLESHGFIGCVADERFA